jgi:LysM repeat protein
MSHKAFAQVLVLVLLVLAVLGVPLGAQAGGVCGGTWIADPGDTVEKIAAICGTSASAIYAANPGIGSSLYAGQSLFVPSLGYNSQPTVPVVYPPVNYTGTYVVQYLDTFSSIAGRFGVSVNALWAANPHIVDINYLYVGQIINVPFGQIVYPTPGVVGTPTEVPPPLSYGEVPAGTPVGKIQLSNKAKGDVYVSLQGTTAGGFNVIREYPVSGTINVKVPLGWYTYVAWVGGEKFVGQFNLRGDSDHTITFFSNKVVVN